MFFSVNGPEFTEAHPELVRFVRDPKRSGLSPRYQIYLPRALKWEHVDLVANRIRVACNDWRHIEGTPKGGTKRTVPLNSEAVKLLKGHRHLRSEYVFVSGKGGRLGLNENVRPLWSTCRRARLRNVTWHTLRHTFASHLSMRGVPMKTIADLMGHSTA